MASYIFKKKDLYKPKEVFKKYDSTALIRDQGELEKEKIKVITNWSVQTDYSKEFLIKSLDIKFIKICRFIRKRKIV